MDEGLGSRIATSAVPGYQRAPSSVGQGSGEVSWDEMGQLGLHRALHEYYKLSASQRSLRLCPLQGRDGSPGLLCQLVQRVLVPQLPAALAPPALLAAAGWALYAAAWLLYSTAALTIPLALWLLFAADGSLGLRPAATAAAARLHPSAGAAAERLHATAAALPRLHPPAAAAALLALLLLLRAAEGAVLRARRASREAGQRRVTAAAVQARYARWAPPGAADGAADAKAAAAAASAAAAEQGRQLLALLRGEVSRLWHTVFGEEAALPAEQLTSMEGVAAAVARLGSETGVQAGPGAGNGDAARLLLQTVQSIKKAVGLA